MYYKYIVNQTSPVQKIGIKRLTTKGMKKHDKLIANLEVR